MCARSRAARRLLRAPPLRSRAPAADSLSPHALRPAHRARAAGRRARSAAVRPRPTGCRSADGAGRGIQDITNRWSTTFRLNDVLRMILETMYRALGFRRVVFCLRDARTGALTGRFGLGDGAEARHRDFRCR